MAAMSSTATLRPPNPRRSTDPPVAATVNDGDLPLDLLYEILLRLPAGPLCRFRAVCRSWRSLLCHPEFIAAARNPGLLLAVGVKDYSSSNEVHVLDMESGDAVKHVSVAYKDVFLPPYGEMSAMSDERVTCVADMHGRLRLIDLASGAVSLLPDEAPSLGSYTYTYGIVGHAASTGEHKVLAIATSIRHHERQVCKILTLGLGDSNSGWRDTGSPPLWVGLWPRRVAVVNGVAYFLLPYIQSKDTFAHQITGFDFNTETWRGAASFLQGPANCHNICLAKLEGHLVAGHADGQTSIELWFLVDLGRSLWSKRYTITMPCYQNNHSPKCYEYFEKPLAVLDDGRIVMWMRVCGTESQDAVLRIYNPRTKTFRDGTRVPMCSQFSVFTWNLLRSGQRGELDMAAKRLLFGRRHHQSGATSILQRGNHIKKRRTSDLI